MKIFSKLCSLIGFIQPGDIQPFVQTVKNEQNPTNVKLFQTYVPDGKSMDDWYNNNGWIKTDRTKPKETR